MWKESLPVSCPPVSAKENKIEVFRILKEEIPSENDFLPFVKLYPENERYKTLCKAYALSFYDTIENAKAAWQEALGRGNDIGKFVAQYEMLETHGRSEYKIKTGHFSTWLYNGWEFKNFNPSFVKEIK